MSISICQQLKSYLIDEKLENAINIPFGGLSRIKDLELSLKLSETIGRIQSQINKGVIKKVQVECSGTLKDSKPVALAFLKGFLASRIPDRINYINSEALAIDLGIKIEHSYTNDSGSYTNLIRTRVSRENEATRIAGSIFDQNKPRLVNILGFDIDVEPAGFMLFAINDDVPGVIGKVGSVLGESKINISGYILSRIENNRAFSVIRVESVIPKETLDLILEIPEINSLQQLSCDE